MADVERTIANGMLAAAGALRRAATELRDQEPEDPAGWLEQRAAAIEERASTLVGDPR